MEFMVCWIAATNTLANGMRKLQRAHTHTDIKRAYNYKLRHTFQSELQFFQIQLFNLKFIPAESNSSEIHYRIGIGRSCTCQNYLNASTATSFARTHWEREREKERPIYTHLHLVDVENIFNIWYTQFNNIFSLLFRFFFVSTICCYILHLISRTERKHCWSKKKWTKRAFQRIILMVP